MASSGIIAHLEEIKSEFEAGPEVAVHDCTHFLYAVDWLSRVRVSLIVIPTDR